MTHKLNISSIKLIDGGINGLTAFYQKTESKNGRDFIAKITDQKPYPIHAELEETFGWLKGYLLDLCNYSQDKTERDVLMGLTEVTEIKYTEKGFSIHGTMKGDKKTFPIQTPTITKGDGYVDFFDVTKILDAIYTETQEYLGGNKTMSDKDYVMKINKDNKEFDAATFQSLPPEEQFKIANEYMAKNKFLVVPMDIVMEEDSELKSDITFSKTTEDSFKGTENLTSVDELAHFPNEAKVIQMPVEVKTSKVIMQEVDGDVIVNILEQPVPVKQKKAK